MFSEHSTVTYPVRHFGRVEGIRVRRVGSIHELRRFGLHWLGWIVKFQLYMGCVRLGLVKLQLVRFFGDKKS